ncbi:MAG TPA: amino acid permease [Candidatus Nanopelagicaceae bacterium]|nr:amino acid permease [Candidatus Nanopelagicaceae bacterium]
MPANEVDVPYQDEDAKRLAELGYKQEFDRKWSGFSNFAISFSIISILSGGFTTFGQAWNNGGPVAISIGWPVIASFILIIGFVMSELVSAMPTAGGIYYWSFRLGKPVHAWLTGWLNLAGLVAVIAGVDYGFAFFFTTTANLYNKSFDSSNLSQVFLVFLVTLIIHVLMNVYGAKVINKLQNVNVWWHVFGVAVIVLVLIFVPSHHQTVSWVFTHRINNSGFSDHAYWFYVLPLGFLLTQYTITGFDASAHVSEETGGASSAAAKGLWKSIFYAGLGGWIMLLAFLFAATHEADVTKAGGSVVAIFLTSMPLAWTKLILIISCVGQFFCGMSCITAASRMLFAFSRDRAVPGHGYWVKLDKNRNPSHAAAGVASFALVLTLPALKSTVAFFAVTSVTVIGLYLSFLIPIYLRWRVGDHFVQGPWNLGKKWKWMAPIAVAEISIICVYFILPFSPAGWPGNKDFAWTAVNYTPLAILIVIGGAMVWWSVSAKKWFTGPVSNVETPLDPHLLNE